MAKTVKITTDNHISIVEVPWNVEAQGKMIGADCTETVKTQRMYDLFNDYVVMIVDESGLIKHRPDNLAASYLYGADIHGCTIAGDVLLGIQKGPEILPPDDAEAMKNFLMQQFPSLSEAEKVENIEITGTDPAKIVRSILEHEGLNQQELADKMGVARQNVSQALNRSRISMRFDNFEKMVSALGYEIITRKK